MMEGGGSVKRPIYMHLEAEMLIQGYTNETLSKAIGISKGAFYKKRYGHTDFTLGEIKKLIKVLNLSPERVEEIFLS
jgi:DNA-binding XRE family transcriptional regulator